MTTPPPHAPATLFVGTYECIERECPEYLTADGYDDPTVERCSHITTEVVCILCSVEDDGIYHETTPWPCASSTEPDLPDERDYCPACNGTVHTCVCSDLVTPHPREL